MPHTNFRQLSPHELDLGYSVYLSAFEWLKAKGIRQWLVPMPLAVYEARQARGENYGLFVDNQLAVIVSLGPGTPAEWTTIVTDPSAWWIHTLATGLEYRGQGLGALTIQRAATHLREQGLRDVYLDCLAGFLPAYYAKLGFLQLIARDITYPFGNTFLIVLMKKDLRDA